MSKPVAADDRQRALIITLAKAGRSDREISLAVGVSEPVVNGIAWAYRPKGKTASAIRASPSS